MDTYVSDKKKLDHLVASYYAMVTARELDLLEQSFTGRGEAFFHVSGAGHEGSAVLNSHLVKEDRLHCHYRDKALMLARGISAEMFFLALFNKDASHSRGRQMNAHMSAPELNILSLVGPVGNSALQAVGVAEVLKHHEERPIVLCSLGDGMTQQGEVLEGIAHAVRRELPVLFLVQDNSFAISTVTTGKTFYSRPDGRVGEFYGVPITRVDGRHPADAYDAFGTVVGRVRTDRQPQIIVFDVDRLNNHTNADDQRMYRTADEILRVQQSGDPLIHLKKDLVEHGVSESELDRKTDEIRAELAAAAKRAQRSRDPEPTFTAMKPLPERLVSRDSEYRGISAGAETNGDKSLTMIEAIREVLDARMAKDERVTLFGEDLEDPKGDVFGVTRGLTVKYPGRVRNSPLAEATIVGVSVGEALAGNRPVAFLQFADFLPIAYNQIFAELGSMFWRTDGGWQAPVIVMITCGGYRPGLGPFHASSLEAIAAHTPGVDVFMPSTAPDAAGLLNAAFESERPTLFFYPKNCLNDRANATSSDVGKQLVPIGIARTIRSGDDLTFVAWGNTVSICLKAADALADAGVNSDVIDLRSLVPWDVEKVLESVHRTGRLIVVHEDSHTDGHGAEVIATIAERSPIAIQCRRVTRADTYVPCNFANQLEVLPSFKRTLETAVELLGGTVRWKLPLAAEAGIYNIEAIGSSPSDESVTVLQWFAKPGDTLTSGDLVAELEADKASFEMKSPVSGTVADALVEEGEMVKVGTPILRVETGETSDEQNLKPVTKEDSGTPILDGLDAFRLTDSQYAPESRRAVGGRVGIAGIASARGSRVVSNEEICRMCPQWTPDDIFKKTGIQSRTWVAPGETALTLAVDACRKLFDKTGIALEDIDAIICSTGTPIFTTPAMATLIQHRLANGKSELMAQAYDISAACSGYLYALQIAYDYLQSQSNHRVLVVTTEVLSPKLNTDDPGTFPIFSDAATASLVVGEPRIDAASATVHRPVLSAMGEDGSSLCVPIGENEFVSMDGPKVFQEAVKHMIAMLQKACVVAETTVDELDLIVPHQANQRIINAIRQRIKASKDRMYSNIEDHGNTSSNTIPLCLEQLVGTRTTGDRIGLTAFGGGFTFAGGVLKVL